MKCDELIEKIKQADDDYRHKFIPIHLDIEIEDILGAFAELKAEIENLKNNLFTVETDLAMATRWRKCSEELPEEGVEVLVTNGIDCGISDWCGDYWNNDPFCGYTVCDNVIAWMPMPKAPEVK